MADDLNSNKLLDSPQRAKYEPRPICAGTSHSCNKLFLFLFALVYLFVGGGMFALGLFVELEKGAHRPFNKSLSLPVALIMFVGVILFVNAIGGLYGIIREKLMFLKVFLAFTVISFIVQIGIGVAAYIYRQQVAELVKPDFMNAVYAYGDSTEFTEAMRTIQKMFGCCGVTSFNDYEHNPDYSCKPANTDMYDSCGVPESCCTPEGKEKYSVDCGRGVRRENVTATGRVYVEGCVDAFTNWLATRLDLVGAVALGFAIPQVIGILLAYYFMRRVRDLRCWYTVANSDIYQTL